VNFWRPGGRRGFGAIAPGSLFLFKLHYPAHAIVGGGWFVRFEFLPVSLAWAAFGRKNGVRDRAKFLARIRKYRRDVAGRDPVIGCIVLTEPFFFSETAWIDAPADWPRNTVQGKTYDLDEGEGARIWDEVRMRLASARAESRGEVLVAAAGTGAPDVVLGEERPERWTEIRARLGQGGFRVAVTGAYRKRCAVTGEKTLPVLEAAHIRPYAEQGPNDVRNGLLLRSDLHRLFDAGYLTIDPDHRVVVSRRIREEFENGREYYRFDGQRLANLPRRDERPERSFLVWHNEKVFEAGR
jgi:putative restriction endonuclease